MKKKALKKDFYMEVRKTLNRFLSIFLIVALGVAFFAGVRATKPDMQLSADAFYDESNLMDIRVLGDLGLTESDLQVISKIEGVREVMPFYSVDMLCDLKDAQLAVQLMSVPDGMNKIQVEEGRMPEKTTECLVDNNMLESGICRLGDQITVKSGTEDATEDFVHETVFTIVGGGTTSYYLSYDYGTTTIGNGTREGFVVVPEDAFSMDYYTQICITVDGAKEITCYTDAYDDKVDTVVEKIEDIAGERCEIRYNQVMEEADEKIKEAETDLAEGEQKLEDARIELENGRIELEDARIKLADAELELKDGEQELNEKVQELEDAKQEIKDGWATLLEAQNKLVLGTIEVQNGYKAYEEKKTELDAGYAALEPSLAQLPILQQQLEALKQQREDELAQASPDQTLLAQYEESIAGLEASIGQITTTKAALDAGAAELAAGKAELEAAEEKIMAGNKSADEAEQKLFDAEAEVAEGEAKITEARIELADGKAELADAQAEFAEAEQKLNDGQLEYDNALLDNEDTIADAKLKIADAKTALADLEIPEWYVLDRQYIQTYVEYGQDADRIGAIGEVFPAIFFLVAALVSLTTMTRMVEEERTQIGTLKALGYRKRDIAAKYMLYALLSSVLGSLFGLIVGQKVLPVTIISAYKILYHNLPDILSPLNPYYSISATLAAVSCTTAATIIACYKELLSVPAQLMRPVSPKSGKRVFLEYIPFIWRRLNFSKKATVRNLIRYKKRFFMTVFGIGGCMALLLVGFGVKDSIMAIGTIQFGEIEIYDSIIGIDHDATDGEIKELYGKIQGDTGIMDYLNVRETSIDAAGNDTEKSGYLVVPSDSQKLGDYLVLRDRVTHEVYQLDNTGVIITEKLAKLLDLKVGDAITLKEDDVKDVEVKISHIAENYFLNYIYMDEELYQELYGESPEYNAVFTNNAQAGPGFEKDLKREYMKYPAVSGITFTSGTADRVADMLTSMDTLIYVLVVAAGLLAFIVLYNLNSININERKRELATLKVLGFYDSEVSKYVNRENILLTVIGAGVGVVLGMLLHHFVTVTAETDSMMFGRNIHFASYLYSVLLTFLFSGIVNFSMHFRLKKINMVESMKSVE